MTSTLGTLKQTPATISKTLMNPTLQSMIQDRSELVVPSAWHLWQLFAQATDEREPRGAGGRRLSSSTVGGHTRQVLVGRPQTKKPSTASTPILLVY